jgi:hypothetical protein
MFCLRRIWSSLRLFVGGILQCYRSGQISESGHDLGGFLKCERPHIKRKVDTQISIFMITGNANLQAQGKLLFGFSHVASLAVRSSKRHGPLVLGSAGGKA